VRSIEVVLVAYELLASGFFNLLAMAGKPTLASTAEVLWPTVSPTLEEPFASRTNGAGVPRLLPSEFFHFCCPKQLLQRAHRLFRHANDFGASRCSSFLHQLVKESLKLRAALPLGERRPMDPQLPRNPPVGVARCE